MAPLLENTMRSNWQIISICRKWNKYGKKGNTMEIKEEEIGNTIDEKKKA